MTTVFQDKTTMRKKPSVLVATVFLILSAVAFWNFIGKEYVEKAQESEITTALASVITAEEAYHSEYGTYSSDLSAIGFTPEGKLRAQIYLREEDLPSDYREMLKPEDLPMISKDKYKIVAFFQKGSKIFIQEKDSPLKRIVTKEP